MACKCAAVYFRNTSGAYQHYRFENPEKCEGGKNALDTVVKPFSYTCDGALSRCVRCSFNKTAAESQITQWKAGTSPAPSPIPGIGVCGVSPWRVALLVVLVVFGASILTFFTVVLMAYCRIRRRRRMKVAKMRRLAKQHQPRAPTAYMEAANETGCPRLYLTLPPATAAAARSRRR